MYSTVRTCLFMCICMCVHITLYYILSASNYYSGSNELKVEYTLPRNQKKFFYDDSLMKVLKISRPKAKASITSNKPINDI